MEITLYEAWQHSECRIAPCLPLHFSHQTLSPAARLHFLLNLKHADHHTHCKHQQQICRRIPNNTLAECDTRQYIRICLCTFPILIFQLSGRVFFFYHLVLDQFLSSCAQRATLVAMIRSTSAADSEPLPDKASFMKSLKSYQWQIIDRYFTDQM